MGFVKKFCENFVKFLQSGFKEVSSTLVVVMVVIVLFTYLVYLEMRFLSKLDRCIFNVKRKKYYLFTFLM